VCSAGSASAKSCVYAFLSLVSLFGLDDNIHGAMDCQSYASAAQSFVIPVIEEMTVDGLQSLIMLVRTIPSPLGGTLHQWPSLGA
jgi:hypothetical protein